MRAAVYDTNGPSSVMRYAEMPDPEVGPDDILIQVGAISIEGGDIINRQSAPPPAPAPVAAPAPSVADDPEMREIFLEEADEVIGNARAALAELREQPTDHGQLTIVRRAFVVGGVAAALVGGALSVSAAAGSSKSQAQKIILKRQHREKTSVDKLFGATGETLATSGVYADAVDLYNFDQPEEEGDLTTNQRFEKLRRLEQLGIFVDEAHHAFGKALAKDMGVKVEFVTAEWPTLIAGVVSNKYDIFMGGSSMNMARARTVGFTLPYTEAGTLPGLAEGALKPMVFWRSAVMPTWLTITSYLFAWSPARMPLHSVRTNSAFRPSLAATALAMSTSKPVRLPCAS